MIPATRVSLLMGERSAKWLYRERPYFRRVFQSCETRLSDVPLVRSSRKKATRDWSRINNRDFFELDFPNSAGPNCDLSTQTHSRVRARYEQTTFSKSTFYNRIFVGLAPEATSTSDLKSFRRTSTIRRLRIRVDRWIVCLGRGYIPGRRSEPDSRARRPIGRCQFRASY